MSMFDWYRPKPERSCRVCGRVLRDWQGKDGPCALFLWEQGVRSPVDHPIDDDLKLPPDQLATWRLPSRFRIRARCKCGARVDAEGVCRDETWMETQFAGDP